MKNTKKYMSAGLALTIALFSSVQMFAMAQEEYYPTQRERANITKKIEDLRIAQLETRVIMDRALETGNQSVYDNASQRWRKMQEKKASYIQMQETKSWTSGEAFDKALDIIDRMPVS